ncbi:MAG: BACON domain-containing protein [Anaerolineae bacterium]
MGKKSAAVVMALFVLTVVPLATMASSTVTIVGEVNDNFQIVDSDSGQAQIDVQWSWARPALELDSTGIDFGSMRRGEHVERTLTLSNSGTADLQAKSRSEVPWLSVHPAQFVCAPGKSLTLSVTCDTAELPGGSTVEPAAITIEANAGTQTISASIEVLAPQLVIRPEFVDLGDVRDGDQVEETIVVGNQGSMAWEGTVRSDLPWLAVEPTRVHCEPGHYIPVTVMLRTEAIESGGDYAVSSAIWIEGAGVQRAVGIHARLLRPELGIGRHSLDLGLIGRTDIASVPLEIVNRGTGELEWEITVRGTWIEVIPSSGTCKAGETSTAKVNAYALAVGGESGQAWLTIHSNGGRVDLPASVALSSPMLVVEPLSLDLHSENHAPASQVLRVSNRGVGNLEGTIESRVPWLTCHPTSFSCQTGVSAPIEVKAALEELHEGTHHAIDAVQVTSNAGAELVEVTLTLELTPRLQVSTEDLQIGESGASTFEIENVGEGTLRVEVVPLQDWITVNRRDWTIKAGKKARVRVAVSVVPAKAASGIELRTPTETRQLLVRGG